MAISDSLPMTGYIKMIDIWMIFTMSYPIVVIALHCVEKIIVDRGTRKINVKSAGESLKYLAITIHLSINTFSEDSRLLSEENPSGCTLR